MPQAKSGRRQFSSPATLFRLLLIGLSFRRIRPGSARHNFPSLCCRQSANHLGLPLHAPAPAILLSCVLFCVSRQSLASTCFSCWASPTPLPHRLFPAKFLRPPQTRLLPLRPRRRPPRLIISRPKNMRKQLLIPVPVMAFTLFRCSGTSR